LRSAITKSRQSVRVIFTGSNQDRLHELFARSRAALYEGASIMAFPALGEDFLKFVATHTQTRFGRRIALADLTVAFERVHCQPRVLVDLVFLYVSSDEPSFKRVLEQRMERLLASDQFQTLLSKLTPLQRALCQRLAAGNDVSSRDAQQWYAKALGKKVVRPSAISRALDSLNALHVVSKRAGTRGHYTFDDPMFREWLGRTEPAKSPERS
jgi:Fe2+ or Zn2+ uptake regulation protein